MAQRQGWPSPPQGRAGVSPPRAHREPQEGQRSAATPPPLTQGWPQPTAPDTPHDLGVGGTDRHLTSQIDYNTTLLQRLHDAEQKQLQDQEAMRGREALLGETRQLLNALNDENAELRERVAHLACELDAARADVAGLRGEKGETEGNLKQLNYNLLYQMKEKNTLLETLQSSLKDRDAALAAQRAEADAMRNDLREAAARRDDAQQEMSRVCAVLAAVERQCDEALASFASEVPPDVRSGGVDRRFEAVLDALLRQVRQLSDAKRKEAQRSAVLEAQCAGIQARAESLEQACVELRRRGEAHAAESGGAQQQLQRQLDEARASAQRSTAELLRGRRENLAQSEEALRRVEQMMAELRDAQGDLHAVERACDHAAVQCGAHQVALDALSKADQGADLEAHRALAGAAAQQQRLEGEAALMRRRMQEAEHAVEAVHQSGEQLRRRAELCEQQLEQQKRESELLARSAEQLQQHNDNLSVQVREAVAQRQQAELARAEIERHAQELQQQLQQHLAEADGAEQERNAQAAERRELSEANLSLRAELARREEEWRMRQQAEREQTQGDLRQRDEKNAQLKAALEKLAIQLDKAHDVCRVVTEHRDSLREENDRLRRELDEQHRRQKDRTARALGTPSGSPARQHIPLGSAAGSPGGARLAGAVHAVYSRPPAQPSAVATPFQLRRSVSVDSAPAYPAGLPTQPPPQGGSSLRCASAPRPPPFAAAAPAAPPPQERPAAPPHHELSASPATPPLAFTAQHHHHQQQQPPDGAFSSPSVLRDSSGDDAFQRRMRELDSFNRNQQALEARLAATLAQMKAEGSPPPSPQGGGMTAQLSPCRGGGGLLPASPWAAARGASPQALPGTDTGLLQREQAREAERHQSAAAHIQQHLAPLDN